MIRCLIVDDSPTFRRLLHEILVQDPEIDVIGKAADGEEALEQTLRLRPDVITMDVRMPRRDGLAAIKEIMAKVPTPILVVCADADDEELGIQFQALNLGAVEVLAKPSAEDPARFGIQAEAVRRAVRTVSRVRVVTRHNAQRPSVVPRVGPRRVDCVGIAASTGGPVALQSILSSLPADYPVPVVVVQHIVEGFASGLVRWLGQSCPLRVKLAEADEQVVPGTVLFAPDGKHLLVSMGRVRLDDGPAVRGFKPSATILFASLAREYGTAAAGVVLTGMGDDGVAGLKLIRERGGITAAQGPASSVVNGMPGAAIEAGAAEHVVELDDMASLFRRLARLGDPAPAGATAAPFGSSLTTQGGGSRKRLLLVDDTETILRTEQLMLSDRYELVLARNGKEAVDAAKEHRPHGILMDFNMPVMTGAEALRAIRQLPGIGAIPVIMVTSETDPKIIQSCWEGGCQAILPKPIDRTSLNETVSRFVPP